MIMSRHYVYVIVITLICLKYMQENEGPKGLSASVYISGKSQVPMLYN